MMTETERSALVERLHAVQNRIAQAARAAGRDPADIHLVAATKMNDAERVRTAIQAGLTACGENRVQELLQKYEQGAYEGADLQFIGTLQANKVKYLIGKVSMIQSVSSLKLAQCIDKEAKKHAVCQDILLEINIGREAAKSGFFVEDLGTALEALSSLHSIRIRGLMRSRQFRQVWTKVRVILQKCINYLLTYRQKNTIMYLWTIYRWE